MKRKNRVYLILIMIVITISAACSFIYYKANNNIEIVDIREVKVVTLYPFQSAGPIKKPYSYDNTKPDDLNVLNNIVNCLNMGKTEGTQKGVVLMWGGTPAHLELELINGQTIGIGIANGLIVSQSSNGKTYKFNSPQLMELFNEELQRIYNE